MTLAAPVITDNKHHAMLDLSGLTSNLGALEVGANTEITIVGKENRSTGYQWDIVDNNCGAKLYKKSDEYNKAGNAMGMGAGGERTWIFETLGEDANYLRGLPCELTFVYKRPWLQLEDSPADRKQVTMTIN